MTAATTRLYISPLTPDTLPAILGSTFVAIAQNISYHTIQNFPENSYAYLDLPSADAEKFRKKLHGAVLKGRKMKVENAKPKKRQIAETEDAAAERESRPRRIKRSKKEHNTLEGRDLSPGRKVKRGWTEPKNEKVRKAQVKDKKERKDKLKTQAPSQFTEKNELLFRTTIPANRKRDESHGKKAKKGNKEGVVHEFQHTTIQPSFLRSTTSGSTDITYTDGKGWVDKDGNLVEEESQTISRGRKVASRKVYMAGPTRSPKQIVEAQTSETSSDDSHTDSSGEDEDEDEEEDEVAESGARQEQESEGTSSSGTSSDESSASSSEDEDVEPLQTQSISTPKKSKRKPDLTINPPTPLRSKTSITGAQSTEQSVHPLEALFKKPAKPAPNSQIRSQSDIVKPSLELEGTSSFSFFDDHDANSGDEVTGRDGISLAVPSTPFTSQDLRNREMRSAAPTPDTAHPSRFNSLHNSLTPDPMDLTASFGALPDDETSEDSSDADKDVHNEKTATPISGSKGKQTRSKDSQEAPIVQKLEESEFEKRFWEKRGENNRAWKAKRRTALKEKRQRENRSRRTKNW